ncbi:uncharacterized protein BXZ73DRAFT_90764 [Epithele typhae]|uniref:uncharacterized protein n=1 Tax=Epithele typhae TaxID=378194 RepID=UPI0020080C4D|nr:uncharacterized protein BXZ73DRAFT_90764 [Epithele typhae]KAH9927517.1 hypothetical protein BXZ73DRAFT_90764 [Epithele typhae]
MPVRGKRPLLRAKEGPERDGEGEFRGHGDNPPPPSPRKGASKKRKRNSNAENGDAPLSKQPRPDGRDEATPEYDNGQAKNFNELPSSGSVPIQDADAANILQVLEMVDTQGLLDRVFPLPIDHAEVANSGASSSSTTSMLSLRAMLKESARYPMSVLRAAVKHLYPISSHPRFRPSETASQQLRFCNLAFNLLDQASRQNAPAPLDVESILADVEIPNPDAPTSPTSAQAPDAGVRPRKYALVQHLPTGDWWSSASSSQPAADESGKDLKSLYTAKAELVSIFPSASGSQLARKGTLGDYAVKRAPGIIPHKPPPPRKVSCGRFLDYGPYASFAPYFDQDGVEVGRAAMGEVIYGQEMRRRLRAAVKGKRKHSSRSRQRRPVKLERSQFFGGRYRCPTEFESLLPSEEVDAIKSALHSLEMEQGVEELLQRNNKALRRLEELQLQRLRSQGGGSSVVEVGSEEWDVAQGITESLALLASLRPRASNADADHAPLIPTPSVLHKLQRTLPLEATEGWYGTLPAGRTSAFRDDTTVHVRASATTATKAAPKPTTTTIAPKPIAPAPPYTPYPAYTGSYTSAQNRAGYGTYGASQTQGYYPNASYGMSSTQTGTSSYYPNAHFNGQYYGTWQATSGQSTPQPTTPKERTTQE